MFESIFNNETHHLACFKYDHRILRPIFHWKCFFY